MRGTGSLPAPPEVVVERDVVLVVGQLAEPPVADDAGETERLATAALTAVEEAKAAGPTV